jgi:hypothetical protein
MLLCCLQAVLPHLKEGSSIINTSSITAFKGNAQLVDYASTKGAQVTCCAPAGAATEDATLFACMQQTCLCLGCLCLAMVTAFGDFGHQPGHYCAWVPVKCGVVCMP